MLPGSFGVFETFRILIPGYLAAVGASWYVRLYFPGLATYIGSSDLSSASFIAFGLIAGLILYLRTVPHDRQAVKDKLPSVYLFKRGQALKLNVSRSEATEIYFYLLNNYFPESMRERIFYYGNIYRVAQKAWFLSIVLAILSTTTHLVLCLLGRGCGDWKPRGVFVALLVPVFFLLFWSAERHYLQILRGQVKWLQMRERLVDSLLSSAADPHAQP